MELNKMNTLSRNLDHMLSLVKRKTFGMKFEIHGRHDFDLLASSFEIESILHGIEDIWTGMARHTPEDVCLSEMNAISDGSTVPMHFYILAKAYGKFLAEVKWCLDDEGWCDRSVRPPLMRIFVERMNVSPRYVNAVAVWTDDAAKMRGLSPSGMAASFFAKRISSFAELLDASQAEKETAIWDKRIANIEQEEILGLKSIGITGIIDKGLQWQEGFCRAVQFKDGGFRDAFSSLALKGFLILANSGKENEPILSLTKQGRKASFALRHSFYDEVQK